MHLCAIYRCEETIKLGESCGNGAWSFPLGFAAVIGVGRLPIAAGGDSRGRCFCFCNY